MRNGEKENKSISNWTVSKQKQKQKQISHSHAKYKYQCQRQKLIQPKTERKFIVSVRECEWVSSFIVSVNVYYGLVDRICILSERVLFVDDSAKFISAKCQDQFYDGVKIHPNTLTSKWNFHLCDEYATFIVVSLFSLSLSLHVALSLSPLKLWPKVMALLWAH